MVVQGAEPIQANLRTEFGRSLQALDDLLILEASRGTPHAQAVGPVLILGRNQLDSAKSCERVDGHAIGPDRQALGANETALDQRVNEAMNSAFGREPQRDADFIKRWADALLFHMGADEVQALALAQRQAHHRDTP